ncbi:hypothetical protein P12x_001505 [Tundrisphaera lichenicola]|uniref:hypothetical protein n=1 Tax=Tundrisphaera lichenicola TaxID=2029860 RepID=UPI003EBEA8C8
MTQPELFAILVPLRGPFAGDPEGNGPIRSGLRDPIRQALGTALVLILMTVFPSRLIAQESEPPGPPPIENFETDADGDGIPDGWYNLRDAKVVEGGTGQPGTKCFRFENARPGRPARASRAFGVDGRVVEALVIGLWVRQENVVAGERLGDDPALVIDFLSDPLQLKAESRGLLGPWKTIGSSWTHVSRRFPITPKTRLAILSVGLIGATGVLEIDGMTIDPIPIGGKPTIDLVSNGDFEMGDPAPAHWLLDHGTHRVSPGHQSPAALELKGNGARAYSGLAVPVRGMDSLEVSVVTRASGLRGATGAMASIFFLDDLGHPLPGMEQGTPALRFSGTTPWQPSRSVVDVPRGAARALIQFEKASAFGTLWIDDVRVVAKGGPGFQWNPDHVDAEALGWLPVAPSPEIAEKSALDASGLLDAPAGKHGRVVVKDGRFAFEKGGRARFFGVTLLPPTAYPEPEIAEVLADRLARSGVNLVRLGDLDVPLGPTRSLFDDARDDTKELDPAALARLEHLIAAFKARGIYVAIELQSGRKFRDGDDSIPNARQLPPGGGAAAAFDLAVREAALKAAEALLGHTNPETGLALRDDPVLAWVTLAGELSLFDLVDASDRLAPTELAAVRNLMRKDDVPTARRGWQAVESAQWKSLADSLRKFGLKAPIAGGSHWRRDYDYSAAQAANGLDLIDDRLFYTPPTWADPERRSAVWSRDGGMIAGASQKRKKDRPYVVGQWAVQTSGAWASPYEGADLMLAARTASVEDWDALVRRGVFVHPKIWGAAAAGTGGGEDIFTLPEVINGIPQVFALLPHASSILLHDHEEVTSQKGPARGAASRSVGGWDPREGRLLVETPHTLALAGWTGTTEAKSDGLMIATDADFGVVAVSSLGPVPIAESRRLLVTAVARVMPTGFRWADEWRREKADPGRPPLLHEGIKARVTWTREGAIKAFALDNTGARIGPAAVEKVEGGVRLTIDGRTPVLHWELVIE